MQTWHHQMADLRLEQTHFLQYKIQNMYVKFFLNFVLKCFHQKYRNEKIFNGFLNNFPFNYYYFYYYYYYYHYFLFFYYLFAPFTGICTIVIVTRHIFCAWLLLSLFQVFCHFRFMYGKLTNNLARMKYKKNIYSTIIPSCARYFKQLNIRSTNIK